MESQLIELFAFLRDPKQEVRQIAIHNISGFTGANAGYTSVFRDNADKVVPDIMALCVGNPITAHDALTSLINLSTDDQMRRKMDSADFLTQLVSVVTSPTHVLSDLACMLLSNLSKDERFAFKLVSAAASPVDALGTSTRVLEQLVEVFARGSGNAYNKHANYDFLASVFANVTLLPDGRDYFLGQDDTSSDIPLVKLICFTEHPAVVRRGGVISTIKNCCFDTDKHALLLADELEILPRILLPLCGPEEFDDDDMEDMLDDLQLLPDDKTRETDAHLRSTLLEALLLLATTRPCRDMMRRKKVYPVIRNMHLAETDDDVRDVAERMVQLLMRDEASETSATLEASADDDTKIVEL